MRSWGSLLFCSLCNSRWKSCWLAVICCLTWLLNFLICLESVCCNNEYHYDRKLNPRNLEHFYNDFYPPSRLRNLMRTQLRTVPQTQVTVRKKELFFKRQNIAVFFFQIPSILWYLYCICGNFMAILYGIISHLYSPLFKQVCSETILK